MLMSTYYWIYLNINIVTVGENESEKRKSLFLGTYAQLKTGFSLAKEGGENGYQGGNHILYHMFLSFSFLMSSGNQNRIYHIE